MIRPIKISDLIKKLEDLKLNYGDLRVVVHTTGGSSDFVEEVFVTNHFTESGIEHVAYISD